MFMLYFIKLNEDATRFPVLPRQKSFLLAKQPSFIFMMYYISLMKNIRTESSTI